MIRALNLPGWAIRARVKSFALTRSEAMSKDTSDATADTANLPSTEIAPRGELVVRPGGIFADIQGFEIGQRMAQALVKSDLVPEPYRGNLANCLGAPLDIAQRLRMPVLLVMQNLFVIHGRPWKAEFIIACINRLGNFSPLRYALSGDLNSDARSCRWRNQLATGEKLEGRCPSRWRRPKALAVAQGSRRPRDFEVANAVPS